MCSNYCTEETLVSLSGPYDGHIDVVSGIDSLYVLFEVDVG